MHAGGENLLRGLEAVKNRHPAVFRRGEPRRPRSPRSRRGDPSLASARGGIAAGDAGRAGGGLHRKTGGAPLGECHPTVVEEVLDVHPLTGGEVVDDDDVVVLREVICKVRARPARRGVWSA